MHVGMEASKTNQTRWEWHCNTFTPSLHLVPFCQLRTPQNSLHALTLSVVDLEIQQGGFSHWCTKRSQKFLDRHAHFRSRKSPNWIPRMLEATLDLVKRLEISKELIRECVTVPGCCCCMPLLHNHLMDSSSYVHKNTLLPPLNPSLPIPYALNEQGTQLCSLQSYTHKIWPISAMFSSNKISQHT